jgi:hypothetical protein
VLNGVGVDFQLLRKLTHRWKRVAGLEHANSRATLHFIDDLAEDRPGIVRIEMEH